MKGNDLLAIQFEVPLMDFAPSERKVPFHFQPIIYKYNRL